MNNIYEWVAKSERWEIHSAGSLLYESAMPKSGIESTKVELPTTSTKDLVASGLENQPTWLGNQDTIMKEIKYKSRRPNNPRKETPEGEKRQDICLG